MTAHTQDKTIHPLTRSFKQAADPPLFSASFFVRPSPTAVKGSGYGTSTKQRKMGWRVTGWVVRMMSYSSVLFSRRKCNWRALLSIVLPCVCACMCGESTVISNTHTSHTVSFPVHSSGLGMRPYDVPLETEVLLLLQQVHNLPILTPYSGEPQH